MLNLDNVQNIEIYPSQGSWVGSFDGRLAPLPFTSATPELLVQAHLEALFPLATIWEAVAC